MSAGMTRRGAVLRWRVLPVLLVLLAAGLESLEAAPQAALAASPGASSISAGLNRSCAIENDNAYCWGSDADGALGDGSTTRSKVPVAVDTSGVLAGKTLTQVSTGDDSTTRAPDSAGAVTSPDMDTGPSERPDESVSLKVFPAVPLASGFRQ